MHQPACAPGGRPEEVGSFALLALLHGNLDLLPVCIDRCYDRDQRVARGYFQVRGGLPLQSGRRGMMEGQGLQ